MQCSKHPEHAAAGVCAFSGKAFCAAELVEVEARLYARDNLGLVVAQARQASAAPVTIVNSASAGAAVAVQRRKVNHLLHFCLTLLTGGLWLPVWIVKSC